MPRLRVSDTEYYNIRRWGRDGGVSFMLDPYSCFNPISFYVDQIRRQIEIRRRDRVIYRGIANLSRIKEELERINALNPVEIVTILNVLYKEPDTKPYVTGGLSHIDRVIFAWAYESCEELKKMIEEAMKSTDPEKLKIILEGVWDKLPEELKIEMGKKYKPINKDKETELKGPWPEYPPHPWDIMAKKKREEEAISYA
jgi:hypothetical protein